MFFTSRHALSSIRRRWALCTSIPAVELPIGIFLVAFEPLPLVALAQMCSHPLFHVRPNIGHDATAIPEVEVVHPSP